MGALARVVRESPDLAEFCCTPCRSCCPDELTDFQNGSAPSTVMVLASYVLHVFTRLFDYPLESQRAFLGFPSLLEALFTRILFCLVPATKALLGATNPVPTKPSYHRAPRCIRLIATPMFPCAAMCGFRLRIENSESCCTWSIGTMFIFGIAICFCKYADLSSEGILLFCLELL